MKEARIKIIRLRESIQNNTFEKYEYKQWLYGILDDVLNCDSKGIFRPKDIIKILYEELKREFQYNGFVYHGFQNICSKDTIINSYDKELISFSTQLKSVYEFGKTINLYDPLSAQYLILCSVDMGLYLGELIRYLAVKDTMYIDLVNDEDEVISYFEKDESSLLDISNSNLQALKQYENIKQELNYNYNELELALIKLKENIKDKDYSIDFKETPILNVFFDILYYDHKLNQYQRPNKIYELIYNIFIDEFKYKGNMYHAVRSNDDINILSYTGTVSCTNDIECAKFLSEKTDKNCWIADKKVYKIINTIGFDYSKFLRTIADHVNGISKETLLDYTNESEIVVKIKDLNQCNIIKLDSYK